jgi:hypothetical protein
MILISAKPSAGFWRCGIFHPSEQVEHDDKAFTKEQLEILKAEPLLSVFIDDKKPVKTAE